MKKHVLVILVVLSAFNAFAQQDSLQNQILSYKDSTGEIITNGRALLIEKFRQGHFQKVKEIKDFLQAKVKDKDYLAFYPVEDYLISYWTKEYDTLLTRFRRDDSLTDRPHRARFGYEFPYYRPGFVENKMAPPHDLLLQKLLERTKDSLSQLYSFIDGAPITPENQDYLKLRLQYLVTHYNYDSTALATLNDLADRFLEKYPNSSYNPFIRKYIRYRYEPSKWAFTFEFFSGYTLLTGELENTFSNPVPFGVAFDVYYKRWVLFLRDFIGFNKTKTGVPYNNGVWEKDSHVRTYLPEAALGYVVMDNKTAKIIPFAGYAGTAFLPTDYDQQQNPSLKKAGLQFTNTFTAGVSLDIKLRPSKFSNRMTGLADAQNYPFIRIRYGYGMPAYQRRYNGYSGNMHCITIGIGGFARGVRRKY